MSVTESNVRKYIKGGDVYVGCDVPGTDEAPSPLPGGGGAQVGATQGVTNFIYSATIEKTDIEQASGGVAPKVTEEMIAMEFTMVEGDYVNVKYALGQATEVDDGTTKVLQLGGNLCPTGDCIMVVAEMACAGATKYYGGMIYDAYIAGETTIPVKRGEEMRIAVRVEGNFILTRAEGDQLGQWFEEQ